MAEENQARSLVDTVTRDQLTEEALQALSVHQIDWNNRTTTQIQNLQKDMLKLQRNQEEMKLHYETQFQRIQDMISSIPGFNARGKEKKMFPPLVTQPTLEGGETSGKEIMKPKSVRLDFPLFDGEDSETWCCRAEEFFVYYNIPAEQRLSISAFHMVGEANLWFRELRASKCAITWEEFVQTLRARFAVPAKEENLDLIHIPDPVEDVDTTQPIPESETALVGDTQQTTIPVLTKSTIPASNPVPEKFVDLATVKNGEDEKRAEERRRAPDPVDFCQLELYLLAERSDQKTSTQTLSSFLSPYLPEVAVDFVVLKHRWRWKEEEDATRAGRGGRHCCRRSRAREGTGGPRSRAMGRRLGRVPMLFSVGSRSCRERRRMVRVDDEGQFWAVHFRPKQTDRWHPHELFSKMKFHFKAEGHAVMREDGYPFASRGL
jgi:hypothetical protein